MASDEERNKGIKRKSEESAEESANKHLRPDDGGSSETKQVEQAEENVRESIPIIYCIPNELGTDPQCTVCKTSYPIYIDSSPFKDHCKKKHPDIDTEKNKSEWIFRYFDLVENTQHLRCKICKGTVEVLEFKGQFIDHFFKDEEHKQYVEIMLEGDNEDTEEVKKCRTIDVVRHLYKVFKKKDTIEDNENKEKCEKSKEGISSEKQDEQAEGNVKKTTWIKCCETDDSGATLPKCTLCGNCYPLYIDSTTMKEHLDKKHAINIDEENESPDWIFRYYGPIAGLEIKCKLSNCYQELGFAKFKGPFIEHFDEKHEKEAEQKFKKDKSKNTEKFMIYKKITFVLYLNEAYKRKCKKGEEGTFSEKQDEQENIKPYDARNKAWWMKHAKWIENNKFFCNVTHCPQNMEIFRVNFDHTNFESHVQSHQPEVQLGRNKHITDYLFADNFLVRCNRCNEPLSYSLVTKFTKHLNDTQHITYTAPKKGGESSQGTNNDENTNGRIIALLQYLTENYKRYE